MKLVLVSVLLSASAFAQTGKVLLTCERTTLRDLDKIVITESERSGEIIVSEHDESGRVHSYARPAAALTSTEGLELTEWYGYTRLLKQEGSDWMIEHFDECGGGASYAVCK